MSNLPALCTCNAMRGRLRGRKLWLTLVHVDRGRPFELKLLQTSDRRPSQRSISQTWLRKSGSGRQGDKVAG